MIFARLGVFVGGGTLEAASDASIDTHVLDQALALPRTAGDAMTRATLLGVYAVQQQRDGNQAEAEALLNESPGSPVVCLGRMWNSPMPAMPGLPRTSAPTCLTLWRHHQGAAGAVWVERPIRASRTWYNIRYQMKSFIMRAMEI